MVQFAFLMIGLAVLTLVIAYAFKKYQRVILWAAALILFIGTALSLGLGLVKIVENGVVNQTALFAVVLTFICSAIFVACFILFSNFMQSYKKSERYGTFLVNKISAIATYVDFSQFC